MGEIDLWVWWISAAILLALAEVISLDLVLLMFAGGAAAAGLVDVLGGPWWAQVIAFIVVSGGLLLALRPWLLHHLKRRTSLEHTNVDAYAGREAHTVTAVDGTGGRVKLLGEVWTARSLSDETFQPGTKVLIARIEGATAVVTAAPREEGASS
ncbi:Membrane protein implicated in regulation of membrane protease activity [Micrococcales bacterium KH10]|nr:Membrane protein implicated in regulation of membrane protease activity [Micrococcales bacterium KH10]